MRKDFPPKPLLASTTLLIILYAASIDGQDPKPGWQPPKPRKNLTIFAPKPIDGKNIFKGEADVWLADAIENMAGGGLTPVRDQVLSDYVSAIGNYLVSQSVNPRKQFQFTVTNDRSEDAMSIGGGRVYVCLGLLQSLENEDELAGVLAHEIAHDEFAHTGKTFTRQMFWLTGTRKVKTALEVNLALQELLEEFDHRKLAQVGERVLGFSRFDELEADRVAFYNTYKAGYNPLALANWLERMGRREKEDTDEVEYRCHQIVSFFFSMHPPTAQRTAALSWEANFVKMPPRKSYYTNPTFTEMKRRAKDLH
jgi:predicted Zn-dependent protease